jgi:AbrB family looped-hinge helix DNA binding protein
MKNVILSNRYQVVVPREVRERVGLRPGSVVTVIEKGGVVFLVPARPLRARRGVARGARPRSLREKNDRV